MMIDIIFDHESFVIIDKPAGMNFHSEDNQAGVVVLTCELLGLKRLFSVHRLDKMTSGLLILAKSSKVANTFSQMFQKRQIENFYLAISLRKPKKKQGWIKGDMQPARRGSYKLLPSKNAPAITQFISIKANTNERLFLIRPHTGKTHQIRVALKSIGAPIAGDLRYANTHDAKEEQRGYLHAYALRFHYEGREFTFVTPPKEGERFLTPTCKKLIAQWSKPWELIN